MQLLSIKLVNVASDVQVKVQEPGGPEETYHVTCKWAATVDIKALTQFVAYVFDLLQSSLAVACYFEPCGTHRLSQYAQMLSEV